MNCPTAYIVDQHCVNMIHEYFNEMLKKTTTENTYIEPKKKKKCQIKKGTGLILRLTPRRRKS